MATKDDAGPGGCACECKACDDQRHCGRAERGCRVNETVVVKRRKRKPPKPAKPKRATHPSDCDYPKYAGKVDEGNPLYGAFTRAARTLGEVEAAMDTFFGIAKAQGLLAAPNDGSAMICGHHAGLVHDAVDALLRLLSTEAKAFIPLLLQASVLIVREDESEGETIH